MDGPRHALMATLLLLGLGACGKRDGDLALVDAAVPAAAGSLAPRLAAAPDGAVIASWLEPRALPDGRDGHALRWARLDADGWDAPRDAAAGADWFVNWADTPGVFAAGDLLVAHWLRRHQTEAGASAYAYDVVLATSGDGGASWSAPRSPHHDGTPTEHGFVSHFVTGEGFGLVWLDGRNTGGGGHENHDGHGGGGGMTLRSARFDAAGAQLDEQEVDALTCDCCPTDIANTDEGPLMVYRDRTPEEIRDVFVARLGAAGWDAPRAVGVDRWHMTGCPVNGPAVDAAGARVAVGWFTAEGGVPRVQLAWSRDGGGAFGKPQRIDDGAPVGRVELVMRDDHAIVIWLEQAAEGAALLRARRAWPDGTLGAPRTLATTAAARASGFPRAVGAGDAVYLAWTEVDPSGAKKVKVARLSERAAP